MFSFIARRTAAGLGTLLLSSVLVFLAVQALPGDVATQVLGKDATPDAVSALRGQLGLDQPAWERYVDWIRGALHGDFGTSLVSAKPVGGEVAMYLGNSALIALITVLFAVTGSIVLGIVAGLYRDRWPDHVISTAGLVGMSIPEFVVATVLVLCFSVALPWFPAVVLYGPEASVGQLLPAVWLPALALAIVMAAYIVRMARTSVIDVMASEYVTTARLKGLSTWRVVTRHALPSALLPTLHVIALNVAWLAGGVAVVENVFNYPGIGKLMLSSVQNRDLPVIQAIALISAVVYVACNLAADLGAMALNPRLRTRGRTR
ncbi:ABC transporter permease [Streptomyces fulvoviolaceus]|uniref:ABC transporter permease n=1 Tax=Streptomyces fulvoviolaceus TaxID=285535 RepID=UPI0021BE9EE2|nr:ABC transporter permease [Streptomyces fulvoviolaceus]MCT9075889.1 ABC transporter permease [Streptomyces fulvoviolaceus]